MSKRLTDTNKWEDAWFTELSNVEKLLWFYFLDKCSPCGVFEPSYKLLNYTLDSKKIDKRFIDSAFSKRIHWIDNEKFVIISFIKFQYKNGELNPKFRPHQSVLRDLQKNNLTLNLLLSYSKVTVNLLLQDKDIDKDIDKDEGKEEGKEEKNIKKNFNPDELANKIMLTQAEHDKLVSNYGIAIVSAKMDALAGSAKYGTYKSHYSTLNNWIKKSAPSIAPLTDEQKECVAFFETAHEGYVGKKRAVTTELAVLRLSDTWEQDCKDVAIAVEFMNSYRTGYYKTGFVPTLETFIVKRKWEEVLEDKKVSDKIGF